MIAGALIALALLAAPAVVPAAVEPPTPRAIPALEAMTDQDVEIIEMVCTANQSEYNNGNKDWLSGFLHKGRVDRPTEMLIVRLCTFYALGQIKGMAD
jgi:hypothetical protein